ncbi:MAG: YchF-related putative GTPase [Candidatus Micrarchaeota archaeon]|nr:YchF-related putative GTPase [Candidatus Micrarchaeota archaeon]MDE1834196.1 YchF-related putative GTPase [Candidatus Micrarchaeota archaeon]MDE1859407.1 YchF-related putative GTPase [Candidatus Micrarchaeota archaeon]
MLNVLVITVIIGLVGAPNKGKSTIFSAMTSIDVPIADYAFTTINPNLGVGYAAKKCVEVELGVKCQPRNSICKNGTRYLPINVIDVAGLVPGAHLGKGMGNKFLSDLISADVLLQVVDISGKSDLNGNVCDFSDPYLEVEMIRKELAQWIAGIILDHMPELSRQAQGNVALHSLLSGLRAQIKDIDHAAGRVPLSLSYLKWTNAEALRFSEELLKINKPMIIAANKMDRGSDDALAKLKSRLEGTQVVECSGAIELALSKAAKSGVIEYDAMSGSIKIGEKANAEQKNAIKYMEQYVKRHGGTGVQRLIHASVFELLNNIVAYPVEDETHYADHSGNILPDAMLMKKGATAQDLAEKVHSDLAKSMKYAIDAKRKMRIQKEYELKDDDVIRIVSTAK